MERKVYDQFTMVGVLDYKEKPELKEIISKTSNWKGYSLQLRVNVDGSTQFLDLMGGDMYEDTGLTKLSPIKFKNSEGVEVSLTPKQLENEELFKTVPNFKKQRFHDKEFVFGGEWINEIYSNLETLKGRKVYITGTLQLQYNKEKDVMYKKFVVRNLSLATNQEDEEYCKGQLQIFFTNGAVDKASITKGKDFDPRLIEELGNRVEVKGYVAQYNQDKNTRSTVEQILFPQTFYVRTDKLDLTNDLHKKLLAFILGRFECPEGKIASVGFEVTFKRGNSEIELSEEQKKELLTKEEIQYLELFPDQKDRFLRNKLQMTMERIDETYLIQPHANMPIQEIQEDMFMDMLELYKTVGAYEGKKDGKKETKTNKVEENTGSSSELNFGAFFS